MKIDALSVSGACVVFAIYACSSDAPPSEASPPPVASDAGTAPDVAVIGPEQPKDEPKDDAGIDAGTHPKPVFLEPAAYADLVTIDPKFPYGVTRKHAADGNIYGSHWGRHGGPIVTLGDGVIQWSLPPDPTANATMTTKSFVKATGLPDEFFYGGDGLVDLPFGPLALLDYTGANKPFPGEALIYDATYQTVTGRAKANGFYSGAGIAADATGKNGFLIYSALSALAASDSDTEDNGLYLTGICDGKLLAPPPCPASRKLFGWTGNSGPVVTDAHGNAFVAASVTGGETSEIIYGLGKSEIAGGGGVEKKTIAAINSGGTASFTALAPADGEPGWLLGLGFSETSPIYAAPYEENAGAVAKTTDVMKTAITRADGVDSISVFADGEGNLWLAVVKGDKGTYLELRRTGEH